MCINRHEKYDTFARAHLRVWLLPIRYTVVVGRCQFFRFSIIDSNLSQLVWAKALIVSIARYNEDGLN